MPKNKKELDPVEEFKEGNDIINDIVINVYNKERTKDEPNFYDIIVDILKQQDKEVANRFKKHVNAVDPTIPTRNSMVQRLSLSNLFITHLYIVKSIRPDIQILGLMAMIPYNESDDEWLRLVTRNLLPHLVQNNLI